MAKPKVTVTKPQAFKPTAAHFHEWAQYAAGRLITHTDDISVARGEFQHALKERIGDYFDRVYEGMLASTDNVHARGLLVSAIERWGKTAPAKPVKGRRLKEVLDEPETEPAPELPFEETVPTEEDEDMVAKTASKKQAKTVSKTSPKGKVAAKVAAATNGSGKRDAGDEQTITPLTKENYRRADSHGHKSLAIILAKPGLTVKDYKAKGGRLVDLRWELKHGHVKLSSGARTVSAGARTVWTRKSK